MSENRISHLADMLDISKMTPEQQKKEEADFLSKAYICDKCKSLHMTSENIDGKVCFPPMGDHHCDGILRKAKDLDDVFGKDNEIQDQGERA